eukprot:TRINITY_DN5449_c0_g1_i1.p1 TRINITY_DN5449_c0_g1~~TRINITY_DN5449_c0_g1_i1.p1  ORF type:complete len:454 (-),score=143.58 TRINITY_DN5449_c0_g1_i1:54-1415(-)
MVKRQTIVPLCLSSRFRNAKFEDMKKAILHMDVGVIGEHLDALVQYVPDKEEVETLNGYSGAVEDLGKAEQYFLAIKDIPRLENRLKAFSFSLSYQQQYEEIKPDVIAIIKACEEVSTSPLFRQLLEYVLSVGNVLNSGGFKGGAQGFKLDVLNKLKDTKTTDNKLTLLHYITRILAEKSPDVIQFVKELPHVPAAARASVPTLQANVLKLKAGITQIERELESGKDNTDPEDKFNEIMGSWVSKRKTEVEELEETFKQVDEKFKETCTLFAERAESTSPDAFFGSINSFGNDWMRTHQDNVKKAEALAKAAQKEKDKANPPAGRGAPGGGRGLPGMAGRGRGGPALSIGDIAKQGNFKARREEMAAKSIEGGAGRGRGMGRGAPGAGPGPGAGPPGGGRAAARFAGVLSPTNQPNAASLLAEMRAKKAEPATEAPAKEPATEEPAKEPSEST